MVILNLDNKIEVKTLMKTKKYRFIWISFLFLFLFVSCNFGHSPISEEGILK